MAPELLTSLDAAELKDLAQRVSEFQETRRLSDSAMLKRFAALGSTKTYKNILNGKLDELNLENQLTNYRSVIALIEASRDEQEEEALYADFVGSAELKRVFLETSQTLSIARFILVQGDTGTGKSACFRLLLKWYGMRFLASEARVAWGDRPRAMLCSFLVALGVKELPLAEADCELKVIELLNQSRRGILIDEGHHLGPRCLNTLKTLINQTPGEVVVFAMKTLWARLERAAYEECRQLTGNRLAERIRLELQPNDIERVLEGRMKWAAKGDVVRAVKLCLNEAPLRGNHGFIREVCKIARRQADDEPVTLEIFTNAIAAERAKR